MNETQPDILLFGLIATFTPIPEGIVIFLQISQRWLVVLVHVDSAMLMTQYICEVVCSTGGGICPLVSGTCIACRSRGEGGPSRATWTSWLRL